MQIKHELAASCCGKRSITTPGSKGKLSAPKRQQGRPGVVAGSAILLHSAIALLQPTGLMAHIQRGAKDKMSNKHLDKPE